MLDEAKRATAFMPMAAFGALAKESEKGKGGGAIGKKGEGG